MTVFSILVLDYEFRRRFCYTDLVNMVQIEKYKFVLPVVIQPSAGLSSTASLLSFQTGFDMCA